MREFMASCVTAYLDHTGLKADALRCVPTPFLPAPPGGGDGLPDDDEGGGELAQVACSVLMKVLYGARLALSLIHISEPKSRPPISYDD